jgi:hypothetical protein
MVKSGLELYNTETVVEAQNSASTAHRAFEKKSLQFEIDESAKAAVIAGTQATAAQKALLVAVCSARPHCCVINLPGS